MMMKLQEDLSEFIELLNSAKVKYLIVGGYAVAYHGFPRDTGDIDFFVESSGDNADRIVRVIREFGFSDPNITPQFFVESDQIVQFGREPYRIDILTSISAVEFSEAWESAEKGKLGGHPVRFISKELLMRNKRASGRKMDLADVDKLERT